MFPAGCRIVLEVQPLYIKDGSWRVGLCRDYLCLSLPFFLHEIQFNNMPQGKGLNFPFRSLLKKKKSWRSPYSSYCQHHGLKHLAVEALQQRPWVVGGNVKGEGEISHWGEALQPYALICRRTQWAYSYIIVPIPRWYCPADRSRGCKPYENTLKRYSNKVRYICAIGDT